MKIRISVFVLVIALLIPSLNTFADIVPVIPLPVKVEKGQGFFYLSENTQIIVDDEGYFTSEVFYLQSFIKSVTGDYLSTKAGNNKLIIRKDDNCDKYDSYKIDVSVNEIIISSCNTTGIYYAVQTLKQLIESSGDVSVPVMSITDYPAYSWRGFMLDVSRHFFSIEYLKRQIDLLSYFKFNKFHLHLTDDQGWRIEIKQYPELTQRGAWRTYNKHDSLAIEQSKENPDFGLESKFIIRKDEQVFYGGFYTQEEIKDLISYAAVRHIEIIPEIDMPGHMMAAIGVFPDLSCTGEASWGDVFSVPLCPCNEATYSFLENVLDEIINLFPSKYIHIGADEVEKNTWKESASCIALMDELGNDSLESLQRYFVERIQAYLTSKGKETIGWDESLEGGINPDLNIMYWRDWIGGVPEKAIKNGNKIIFTPGYPLYISRPDSSLYDVYHLKALKSLSEDEQSFVLGAQANLWTEQITSENRADYLIYPRLIALSEVVWTPGSNHNWESFKSRLDFHLSYLNRLGIKYSQPPYTLIPSMVTDTVKQEIRMSFDSERVNPDIYYSVDGTSPTLQSNKYNGPIRVSGSADIEAAIYADGKMQEPVFKRSVDYHKGIGKKVTYLSEWHASYPAAKEKTLTDGLRGGLRYNDGFWQGFTSDFMVIIDMEEITSLNDFSATFMQITGPGVYMPEYVEVGASDDGENFDRVLKIDNDVSKENEELVFKKFQVNLRNIKARYIKVFAKQQSGFMFVDEIVIN